MEINPLHTTIVKGRPLRFFRTPYDDGRPDLPSHSVDDLQRILGMSKQGHTYALSRLTPLETIYTEAGGGRTAGYLIHAHIRHEPDLVPARTVYKFGVSVAIRSW